MNFGTYCLGMEEYLYLYDGVCGNHSPAKPGNSSVSPHVHSVAFQACLCTAGYTKNGLTAPQMPTAEKALNNSTTEPYNMYSHTRKRRTIRSTAFPYTGCLAAVLRKCRKAGKRTTCMHMREKNLNDISANRFVLRETFWVHGNMPMLQSSSCG